MVTEHTFLPGQPPPQDSSAGGCAGSPQAGQPPAQAPRTLAKLRFPPTTAAGPAASSEGPGSVSRGHGCLASQEATPSSRQEVRAQHLPGLRHRVRHQAFLPGQPAQPGGAHPGVVLSLPRGPGTPPAPAPACRPLGDWEPTPCSPRGFSRAPVSQDRVIPRTPACCSRSYSSLSQSPICPAPSTLRLARGTRS